VRSAAFAGIAAIFAIGLWLIAAPFLLGFQPSGARWVLATQTCVILGGVLSAAAFAAFFIAMVAHIRGLYLSKQP
jgi:hypothetical protein